MNQRYFLIFGIIAVIVVVAVILISGYIGPEKEGKRYAITENPVVINKDIAGAPSSPMDLILTATQFSENKTSEITVKIGKREGYEQRIVWADIKAEIRLPENLELIEGNSSWQGDIPINEYKEFKIKVKAIKNGEGILQAVARYTISEDTWFGDGEVFYVLVKDNEVLISDRSFTLTPRERGEKVYVEPKIEEEHEVCPEGYEWNFYRQGCVPIEHEVCPEGYEWNFYRQGCVPIEHEVCPEGYTWNSNLQKCVLLEHEECPEGYIWDEISQSCQRGEEPVSP